jgi:hypothetical protein
MRQTAFRFSCAVWGHVVHNEVFRRASGDTRRCRCGARYLNEDGSRTHVRHTLSCFLRHHTYTRLADRDGVHEYVCVRCGHPLVYPAGADPFDGRERFGKKVRYFCGLFGHQQRAHQETDGVRRRVERDVEHRQIASAKRVGRIQYDDGRITGEHRKRKERRGCDDAGRDENRTDRRGGAHSEPARGDGAPPFERVAGVGAAIGRAKSSAPRTTVTKLR